MYCIPTAPRGKDRSALNPGNDRGFPKIAVALPVGSERPCGQERSRAGGAELGSAQRNPLINEALRQWITRGFARLHSPGSRELGTSRIASGRSPPRMLVDWEV